MSEEERQAFLKQKEQALKQMNELYSPQEQKPNNSFKKVKPKETFGLDFLRLINFKNLKLDNDRLIIITLILLLITEEPDELLVLALIYIMLWKGKKIFFYAGHNFSARLFKL